MRMLPAALWRYAGHCPFHNLQKGLLHSFSGNVSGFVGRVPINVTLQGLDRDALVRILKEPKSALVKQYHSTIDSSDGI